jgi:DNA mismatch endonuclease (patch repair protein)
MTRDPVVTSRIMAAVRSTGTRPEMTLRRALFRRGLRYRVRTTLPGKPDLVFPAARVACFVDGAFWHGAGWQERGYKSMEEQFEGRPRGEWWIAKIRRNIERDQEVTCALESDGWRVLRFWDTEVTTDPEKVAAQVEIVVRERARHPGKRTTR